MIFYIRVKSEVSEMRESVRFLAGTAPGAGVKLSTICVALTCRAVIVVCVSC